ncbi:MAG: SMP-30/gluconolactonase/LRE family protein, partial [Methylobacteriaceae bacterium]|nr:SMP-30/gluconolactonase/LRE family protein [Methylobacteriaceae bacterium]
MVRIELLIDAHAELGEGPLWDVAEQRLYWIDSLGAMVHSCDAAGGAARSWKVPGHIGSLALREKRGAVLALRDGFYTLDFATGTARRIADPDPGKPRIRMNDGKVDRQGRFVAGYMDYEEREPLGSLFRLSTDFQVTRLESRIV